MLFLLAIFQRRGGHFRPKNAQQTAARRRANAIGTMNGQPITANDLILLVNSDSPFMPPLDGSPVPVLQQFENKYPANPATSRADSYNYAEAVAPSFSVQIQNMMKTGQEWLFKSLLDVIIKPMMPMLIFFAWIIASFVLNLRLYATVFRQQRHRSRAARALGRFDSRFLWSSSARVPFSLTR